jgi:DNA-binding MarR family transcriptional regulator
MNYLNSELKLILALNKAQTIVSRRFDSALNGLSLTEFIILHTLEQNGGDKIRRVELAEKIGFTASGITRLLAPMEKIGLVKRQKDDSDARVSYVSLAPGGKRKLEESMQRAELHAKDFLPNAKKENLETFTALLNDLVKNIK